MPLKEASRARIDTISLDMGCLKEIPQGSCMLVYALEEYKQQLGSPFFSDFWEEI